MSMVQTVTFRNPKAAEPLTDQEIERRLTTGRVSNTARSIHEARKQGFAAPAFACGHCMQVTLVINGDIRPDGQQRNDESRWAPRGPHLLDC